MFIRYTSVNIQSSTWLPVTGLLVRMTMLFNWRWDDVQTLPAWWTVTRTIIYATLSQRTFYLKNLWMQALRIGQYSKRSVRKSSSKYFASSPLLFFTRNNYDTLLANVVSKARKFVLWTDFWPLIWNGDVAAVLSIPVQNAPSPPRGALSNLCVLKCSHSISFLRRSFESILVQILRPYSEKQ